LPQNRRPSFASVARSAGTVTQNTSGISQAGCASPPPRTHPNFVDYNTQSRNNETAVTRYTTDQPHHRHRGCHLTESKIDATHRLHESGQWHEASIFS